ncbi:MAG: hypothetical protein EHM42_03105, partial [Planctomycetaceae bacterium]
MGALLLVVITGCTRPHYRRSADCETYALLDDRVENTPWLPPAGFSIVPEERSRLCDPADPDFTDLPDPEPQLYSYQIPPLDSDGWSDTTGGSALPRGERTSPSGRQPQESPALPPLPAPLEEQSSEPLADPGVLGRASATSMSRGPERRPAPVTRDVALLGADTSVHRKNSDSTAVALVAAEVAGSPDSAPTELNQPPVSAQQWAALPTSCVLRMLEFEQLRAVYVRSHGESPPAELRSPGRAVTLENIVEIGLLNSREFQTQKETLYKTALAVTLAQFDYVLKATPFGNGADLYYRTFQVDGEYFSDYRTAPRAEIDKALVTGGTFVGRFANNVLLTFNGPEGFASDITSRFFFDISQPLLQRDIRFENLTRAERNLIYAARSYLRFRKTYFLQLATEYYQILRSYRQIAIESQNYFSLSGAHNQALIELEAGIRSRIQAEQIEQNMLAGRSRLITAGVTLERALDRLKLDLGIPTELPLRVDLQELDDVTGRDETAVLAEAVRRTRERLTAERDRSTPQGSLLVNAAIVLHQRLVDLHLRGVSTADLDELKELGFRLALSDSQIAIEQQWRAIEEVQASNEPVAVRLVQRRLELIDAHVLQVDRQLTLSQHTHPGAREPAAISERNSDIRTQAADLRRRLGVALDEARLEDLSGIEQESARLVEAGQELVAQAGQLPGADVSGAEEDSRQKTITELVDRVLARAASLLTSETSELTPVEIELDDAMLTALALRLDLMNRRGELADARRAEKLAADDLRSVLNLHATETLGTDAFGPYDFRIDSAQTEVRAEIDLPFNRKAQRNLYRTALINYQVARRAEMQQEDTIKFSIRDDLRNLALARNQYQISIASAALAIERVNSTQLELALGFPGVQARDFLEAQDAFRLAVGAVADNHLGYIANRVQFFYDLELLQVDDAGFWQG